MKALDLFCCAGGATKGLQRAGFYVVGVDIDSQPNYCGDEFYQADAMEFPLEGYDFIWASPPCQHYSTAGIKERFHGKKYPDLVAAIRERLIAQGTPWVIENVPGSPVRKDLVLCGSHFGLKVVRHRLFEFWDGRKIETPPCNHAPDVVTVCGHGSPSWVMKQRVARGFHPNPMIAEKRKEMGIDWTNRGELSQAIPPAYSQFIGERVLESLR